MALKIRFFRWMRPEQRVKKLGESMRCWGPQSVLTKIFFRVVIALAAIRHLNGLLDGCDELQDKLTFLGATQRVPGSNEGVLDEYVSKAEN